MAFFNISFSIFKSFNSFFNFLISLLLVTSPSGVCILPYCPTHLYNVALPMPYSRTMFAAVVVVLNLWYFWLCRRVADAKSQGNLYMVLLILGVVGSLVTFFTTKGAGRALSFDAVIDICGLYFLIQSKKEN